MNIPSTLALLTARERGFARSMLSGGHADIGIVADILKDIGSPGADSHAIYWSAVSGVMAALDRFSADSQCRDTSSRLRNLPSFSRRSGTEYYAVGDASLRLRATYCPIRVDVSALLILPYLESAALEGLATDRRKFASAPSHRDHARNIVEAALEMIAHLEVMPSAQTIASAFRARLLAHFGPDKYAEFIAPGTATAGAAWHTRFYFSGLCRDEIMQSTISALTGRAYERRTDRFRAAAAFALWSAST